MWPNSRMAETRRPGTRYQIGLVRHGIRWTMLSRKQIMLSKGVYNAKSRGWGGREGVGGRLNKKTGNLREGW